MAKSLGERYLRLALRHYTEQQLSEVFQISQLTIKRWTRRGPPSDREPLLARLAYPHLSDLAIVALTTWDRSTLASALKTSVGAITRARNSGRLSDEQVQRLTSVAKKVHTLKPLTVTPEALASALAMPTTALAKAFAVTKATARRWKQKGAISQRYHSKLLAAHVTAPVKRKPFKSVTKRFKGAVTSGFVRKWIINSDADVFLATSFAAQVTQETEKLEKRGRKFQFRASGVAQFPINDSDVNVNAYRKGVIVVDPGASEYESRFDLNGFAHRQAGEALSDLVDQLFELATLPATVETIELVVRDYK